jgi:hypothetical protein
MSGFYFALCVLFFVAGQCQVISAMWTLHLKSQPGRSSSMRQWLRDVKQVYHTHLKARSMLAKAKLISQIHSVAVGNASWILTPVEESVRDHVMQLAFLETLELSHTYQVAQTLGNPYYGLLQVYSHPYIPPYRFQRPQLAGHGVRKLNLLPVSSDGLP